MLTEINTQMIAIQRVSRRNKVQQYKTEQLQYFSTDALFYFSTDTFLMYLHIRAKNIDYTLFCASSKTF